MQTNLTNLTNMIHNDLINAYEFCLKYGWVHNTPIDTIINDYKHRQELFKNHVEKIKTHVEKNPESTIHILIGEATPYYPNDIFPLPEHRTYFYDPKNSIHTPYFKEPYNHFEAVVTDWKDKDKGNCLNDFAKCGVLIFDIFPFPIFQTTKNRQRVNRKSVINTADNLPKKKIAFNDFLNNYFCSRLEKLLNNFGTKVKFYLFAPKYTSIQFLSWCYLAEENCALKERLQENLVKFGNDYSFQCSMKEDGSALASPTTTGVLKLKKANILFTKDTIEFIEKIGDTPKHKQVIQDKIREHPIFMDKSGNPNFNKFINGIKNSD